MKRIGGHFQRLGGLIRGGGRSDMGGPAVLYPVVQRVGRSRLQFKNCVENQPKLGGA